MSRAYCSCCQLPQSACLCAHVQRQPCPMPVLILQHPLEAKHAKSTVPLLQLALPGIRVAVAERLAPPPPLAQGNWWLLYPGPGARDLDKEKNAQAKPDLGGLIGGVIVLDGTWRKTRRLLYLNPWLSQLPALTFSQAPASAYAIRKGPGGQALSTLESLCHVLHRLQPDFAPAPVLALLQARVAQFQQHGALNQDAGRAERGAPTPGSAAGAATG